MWPPQIDGCDHEQDRLVKELRLRGIRDVQPANAFAPEFIADYNRRFARAPRSEHDAHRPLQPTDDLARISSWKETRLVSKSPTLNYKWVLSVNVSVGDRVSAGQLLPVLEAMKMEHSITAPHDGTVSRLAVRVGDQVDGGALLAEVAEESDR